MVFKAKNHIEGKNAKVAFVTTNSICQGEQAALLCKHLIFDKIEIGFAYHSFKWVNNAKGNAGVTVIILSLRNTSAEPKYLFTGNIRKEAKNINPYNKPFVVNILNKKRLSSSFFSFPVPYVLFNVRYQFSSADSSS